jgi:hypothetical protein
MQYVVAKDVVLRCLQIGTLLGIFARLRKVIASLSCLPVRRPAWNNTASSGRIFVKFDI